MATVDELIFALTLIAALGSGLIAGLFFAFSVSVMKALARVPAACGIAAMQAINVAILNPLFLGTFFGTGVASALVVAAALVGGERPGALYPIVGGLLYLVGSLFVTIAFNVPRNNALASLVPADADSASAWSSYLARWTAWNHVRTAASLAAAASLTLALATA